jgi:flagellar hook-associated protein 3 FlgL
MTRVSENSSSAALKFSMGKAKKRMEDLQLKGSSLKRMNKPSDDPVGNIDLLTIRSREVDMNQYTRNASFAKTNLDFAETALEDLTEVLSKAKEIAVGQASDIYNPSVRHAVAREIHQLRMQALSIANRRLGTRFIFGGYNTNEKPFDKSGNYSGDDGRVQIEVAKDFFVPINLTGDEIFFASDSDRKDFDRKDPINDPRDIINQTVPEEDLQVNRGMASVQGGELRPGQESEDGFVSGVQSARSIFTELESLETALKTNNPDLVQSLLEKLDDSMNRVITYRTRVGALNNSIASAELTQQRTKLLNAQQKSFVEDADVAELFSDITKQEGILKATYKSGNNLINKSLLEFLR